MCSAFLSLKLLSYKECCGSGSVFGLDPDSMGSLDPYPHPDSKSGCIRIYNPFPYPDSLIMLDPDPYPDELNPDPYQNSLNLDPNPYPDQNSLNPNPDPYPEDRNSL
jgi:hypothetical protein